MAEPTIPAESPPSRRVVLRQGVLLMTAMASESWMTAARSEPARTNPAGTNPAGTGAGGETPSNVSPAAAPTEPPAASPDGVLRIGLMTDLHYADKPPAGTRHYRETPEKLAEARDRLTRDRLDFVVELGDLIDAADSVATEQRYLATIEAAFSAWHPDRYYVLGNHCVDTLTKTEFLDGVSQKSSYFSFDRGGYHFVVLDACFRADGTPYERKNFTWTDANIPGEELEWLAADLAAADKPTVVFAHQRLDVANSHGVNNQAAVRAVLERQGRVRLVLQGHSHHNDLRLVGGVPYCTLAAMVEGSGAEQNGYARLELAPDGTIALHGFRRQASHRWPGSSKE